MSETTAEVAATETTEQGAESTTEQVKPAETLEFWRQESRKQEARAKANADAARRLAELEQQNMTEAEKVTQRATAAEARAAEFEARAVRLEVAFDKGLTPAQAKRLVGASREELEADADEILRDFPVRPAEPVRAVGDIGQGVRAAAPISDPRLRDIAQIEADLKTGGSRR